MGSSVQSESDSGNESGKSIGVRFAESAVGAPIIGVLLFITNSFWLMLTSVGVLLVLVAIALWDGVMAGVIGVFGLSGITVGLLGYVSYLLYVRRQDTRS